MVSDPLVSVHPETTNFWMELSAVSEQQSANTLFLMSFAESRKLMADSAHPKTLVSGCALVILPISVQSKSCQY